MRLDREVIEGKMDIIDRNLKYLGEVGSLSKESFLSSYRDIQAAKHSLLEIVEACIDIANYIISAKGFRRAEAYSEMFKILGENGVLEKKLSRKLQDMSRFRNLLVHRYGEIDNTRILSIVKHSLKDVEEFEKEIERFVGQESDLSSKEVS